MKIKVKPEDFVVREMSDIAPVRGGDFHLYLLEKKLWNTTDALRQLERFHGLNPGQLSYGGRKDRYAHTFQYITVKGIRIPEETGNDNMVLRYAGTAHVPMAPGLISGNRFEITMRDLALQEADDISRLLSAVAEQGFANYFGDQRFGSYDRVQGFFGEKFLKAHYNGALKCLLCSIHPGDRKDEKERKQYFLDHWGEFGRCLDHAKTGIEERSFSILTKRSKAFLNAIHDFPVPDISLYFTAYQSYLWNRMLAKLLTAKVGELSEITIKEWRVPVYRKLAGSEKQYLRDLKMPVPGIKPWFPSDEVERIYDQTLREEGLHQGRFSMRHYRKVLVKSFPREAIVIPEDVKIAKPSPDDVYPERVKLSIALTLPRGCFATVLLKHLDAAS